MSSHLQSTILLVYYATLGTLALYGVHRAVLLWLHVRHRRSDGGRRQDDRPWPRVTVQLPLYNERFVAQRLLRAVAALDYPGDRLQIQLLDDSTDDTSELLRPLVADLRARGLQVEHIRRPHRRGYKAGALDAGLERASGDLVAIFDADFVPHPSFLRRTVSCFDDPAVGMVQASWEHLNRLTSLLTRIQAILLDGHFRIEHAARHWSGRFFNFNGTAGIWRRDAITDSGGWQSDTLTEDLDLSYRAQLRGWRFIYLPEVTVPSELPTDIGAFKTQQYRWAKGSVQTARKLLPAILRSRCSGWIKLEATVHLTSNVCYLLMVLLSLLIFPAMIARQGTEQWRVLTIDLPLFLAATASVVAYYVASQRRGESREPRTWRAMPATLALGIGISLNNARAVLSGLFAEGGTFERTPKTATGRETAAVPVYRARVSRWFWAEGLLALYLLLAILLAIDMRMWLALPFLYLFLQGYAYVFLLTLQSRAVAAPTPSLADSA